MHAATVVFCRITTGGVSPVSETYPVPEGSRKFPEVQASPEQLSLSLYTGHVIAAPADQVMVFHYRTDRS